MVAKFCSPFHITPIQYQRLILGDNPISLPFN